VDLVGEDALRPARPDGTCFYCHTPLGEEHARGCPMRQRTLFVEATVQWVEAIPEDWTPADIEDWVESDREGESRRAHLAFANVIDHEGLAEITAARYVREATAADELSRLPCLEDDDGPDDERLDE
jgi:hypothetical protein